MLLLVSVPLALLPEPERIERNEALCVTALLFLIAPLLMSYPLMASGLSWIDAWFEAVSGITTTGLTTLPSVEVHSQSFLFGRAWMQWYGGLGIGVLAVALFMGHQVTSKKLLASAGEEGRSTTARSYARQVLQVYLLLTLLGFLLIWAFVQDALQALVLKEAEPENTDALFSLLDNEQTNIIVALVARSLKFRRVVPLVAETQFERICTELGLADTVAPNRAVARHLVNQIRGEKSLELAAIIHRDAEVFSFIVSQDEAGPLADFKLPRGGRIICLYRHEKLVLPEETDHLGADDEVILITRPSRLTGLKHLLERAPEPEDDED